jgi:hypothetical protein
VRRSLSLEPCSAAVFHPKETASPRMLLGCGRARPPAFISSRVTFPSLASAWSVTRAPLRCFTTATSTRQTAVYRFGQDLKEARDVLLLVCAVLMVRQAGQMDRAIRLFSSELYALLLAASQLPSGSMGTWCLICARGFSTSGISVLRLSLTSLEKVL